MLEARESRAQAHHPGPAQSFSTAIKAPCQCNGLGDLDALAEALNGRFLVQVTIDGDRRRTNVYRNAGAAERAVKRAKERGQTAHVSLCQLLPIGVVTGMGVR